MTDAWAAYYAQWWFAGLQVGAMVNLWLGRRGSMAYLRNWRG